MAKTDYQSIDEYHNAFPKDAQARMQQIREIIKTIAPEANFETDLKEFKVTKSAIQFPEKDELPLDFIRRIIEFRKAEVN